MRVRHSVVINRKAAARLRSFPKVTPALVEQIIQLKLSALHTNDIMEDTGASITTIDQVWAAYRKANPNTPRLYTRPRSTK
jgi:hypothetical protein